MKEKVLHFLNKLGISYEVFPHAPITTMAEGKAIIDKLGFMPCKNLFLVNKQGQYFLMVMQGDKRFSAMDVARQIGGGHLSFASAEEMKAMLHAEQGAASILGLIFDDKQQVQVLIDKDVLASEYMACHPCVNTCTIKLRMKDVISVFLPTVHSGYLIVDLPAPCEPSASGR